LDLIGGSEGFRIATGDLIVLTGDFNTAWTGDFWVGTGMDEGMRRKWKPLLFSQVITLREIRSLVVDFYYSSVIKSRADWE
jgi:hypothetical protein